MIAHYIITFLSLDDEEIQIMLAESTRQKALNAFANLYEFKKIISIVRDNEDIL